MIARSSSNSELTRNNSGPSGPSPNLGKNGNGPNKNGNGPSS